MNNKIFKLKTKNQISKLLAFLRIVYFNNKKEEFSSKEREIISEKTIEIAN